MKFISRDVHGIVDYSVAPALIILPRLARWPQSLQRILAGMGLFTLAYSMLTDYRLGLLKLLPYRGHLAIDSLVAASTAGLPLLSAEARPRISRLLVGLALAEAAIIALSSIDRP